MVFTHVQAVHHKSVVCVGQDAAFKILEGVVCDGGVGNVLSGGPQISRAPAAGTSERIAGKDGAVRTCFDGDAVLLGCDVVVGDSGVDGTAQVPFDDDAVSCFNGIFIDLQIVVFEPNIQVLHGKRVVVNF